MKELLAPMVVILGIVVLIIIIPKKEISVAKVTRKSHRENLIFLKIYSIIYTERLRKKPFVNKKYFKKQGDKENYG